MASVTISKKEYRELLDKKLRYEYLREFLKKDIFSPPLSKNVKTTIKAFKETRRYNEKFLKSLERGLKRSSHFKS
ncbi:MAG: hypothetical protein WD889_02665 [Candidatus Colwellbacteria bacterium]